LDLRGKVYGTMGKKRVQQITSEEEEGTAEEKGGVDIHLT